MDYYKKKQFLAVVDENDNVLDRIDKWKAHEKGILHRAFTACLFYEDNIILQHRKHPVFDDVYDLTGSSHPYFEGEVLQETETAVLAMLKREWNVSVEDLASPLSHKGHINYRAKDVLSIYIEHEMCHLYTATIKKLPSPNYDFAYGFSLMTKGLITNNLQPITKLLAPWVPPLVALL